MVTTHGLGDGQAGVDPPPVPPALISSRIELLLSRPSVFGARNVEHQPHGGHTHHQVRAAIAEERQRVSGKRKQRQDRENVDQRLHSHPGGHPGGEHQPERIRRSQRNSVTAPDEEREESQDHHRADEAQFLRDHRKHAVGVRGRQ